MCPKPKKVQEATADLDHADISFYERNPGTLGWRKGCRWRPRSAQAQGRKTAIGDAVVQKEKGKRGDKEEDQSCFAQICELG